MGCGSSSAIGRDNYATLSPEPESLTPILFSGDDHDHLPRLDSFIVAPIEDSPPKKVAKSNSAFPTLPVKPAQQKKQEQTKKKVLEEPAGATDLFDDFPVPKNFDTSPFTADPYNFVPTTTTATNNQSPTVDDDTNNISFPSLSDHLPSPVKPASSANNNHSKSGTVPESPAPPSVSLGSAVQSSILPDSNTLAIGAAPFGDIDIEVSQKDESIAFDNEPKGKEPKKKKKKKSKKKEKIPEPTAAEPSIPIAPPVTAITKPKPKSAREARIQQVSEMAQQGIRPEDTPQPSSASGMRFDELYRLKGVLGTGAFSTVREGYHRSSSSNTYAVKCVNRKKLSEEDEAALLDEVEILKEMKHLHIIRLYDFFVEPSTYYLIMERMSGGELFDRIVAKAYYNEKEARDVCKIVLEAVCYCHDNNVAHRDLKPENLLLLSVEDDSQVKIADFGFAKKVYAPMSLTTQCGTPGYVAPEILEGTPYDTRADMWSVGVILYILLGGYPPFIENNQRDLFRKIRRGEYEFHDEYWGTVSAEAKDLISTLLTVDPATRLTAPQALENTWIRVDDDVLAQRDLGVNLKKLTTYNAKRKFKAAVYNIMAVNKLQSLGKDFLKNLS